jgi:hypothetical protein
VKPAPKKVHASKQTVQNGKTNSQSHKNILKERIVPREQRHNTSKINMARDTLSNAWVQVFPPHKRHNTKRSWIFKTCGSISCYSVLRLLNSLQVFGCTDPSKFCVCNLGDCLVRSKESLVAPVSGRILGMNRHIHPYLAHQWWLHNLKSGNRTMFDGDRQGEKLKPDFTNAVSSLCVLTFSNHQRRRSFFVRTPLQAWQSFHQSFVETRSLTARDKNFNKTRQLWAQAS